MVEAIRPNQIVIRSHEITTKKYGSWKFTEEESREFDKVYLERMHPETGRTLKDSYDVIHRSFQRFLLETGKFSEVKIVDVIDPRTGKPIKHGIKVNFLCVPQPLKK